MVKEIISGISSYATALSFLTQHRLLRFFIFPGLIGGLILIGLLWGIIRLVKTPLSQLLEKLVSWIPLEGVAQFLVNQMDWLAIILLVGTGFILFKNLLIAIMSPFMSPLSEKIEGIVRGQEAVTRAVSFTRILRETWRGLRINFRNIIKEIVYTLILLVLGLIPIFSLFSAGLIFVIQSYYAGFGNLDYTLERRYSVKESISFVRDHKGLAVGNGAVFLLLLFIPVLGILVAPPLATAASTLEALKRLPENSNMDYF